MTFCTSPPVPVELVEEIYPIVPSDVKRYFPIAICDGVTAEQLQDKPPGLNPYPRIVQD
jgi:hypothetical protein